MASNSVKTCVVLGGGRIRVSGVRREHRGITPYRVYEDKFSFAPTTLTLLFTLYIVVLLGTLLLFGSVSDYTGRRMVMLAGLA